MHDRYVGMYNTSTLHEISKKREYFILFYFMVKRAAKKIYIVWLLLLFCFCFSHIKVIRM